eukprot:CAMPEP_0203815012 /NCGR_PEP_ID=MMETSP0115-20131106/7395_1 /ASSEMBLY_ACC=CAM_ASM_000227 /TAXON_ID=33651 /ORGANISM="Bicosoecid sp, Strain ms1" /LENGTH=61 /DNA_ID=CAMNT_0050723899 /DNA_START=116 /DNA_END=298 /DNA_ORIENTATION=+
MGAATAAHGAGEREPSRGVRRAAPARARPADEQQRGSFSRGIGSSRLPVVLLVVEEAAGAA